MIVMILFLCYRNRKKLVTYRSSHPEVLCKKGVHLVKPQAYDFIKKEALAQVFSREFCEISKSNFFKHL